MTNIKRYNIIVDTLQERVDNHLITLEQATEVNDLAYEMYVEKPAQIEKDVDMLEELIDAVKDGKVTLTKEVRDTIGSLFEAPEEDAGEEKPEKEDEEKEDKDDDDDKDEADSEEEEVPEAEADDKEACKECGKKC